MTKIDPTKLLVSEAFYSIQGEGKTSGYPAYFVRLSHCNLSCGATPKFVNRFKKGEVDYNPGTFKGDLHEQLKATWTCFTKNHKVLSPLKSKDISEIKIGDILYGFDEKNKTIEHTTVTRAESKKVNSNKLLVIKTADNKKFKVTYDHPFYVNGKWINAEDLKVNDEIYHITNSQAAKKRLYVKSDSFREKVSIGVKGLHDQLSKRMKENNPMKNPETVKKNWESHQTRMSGLEKWFVSICNKNALPCKYIGNGKLWIEKQNPDFIVEGENKLIEIYDSSYQPNPKYKRDKNWEIERSKAFINAGYQCLFIDMYNGKNSNTTVQREKEIVSKVNSFIMNGSKIISIEPLKSKEKEVEVFSIECFPHKNYFVNRCLVHNCDTIPVWARGQEREFQWLIDKWKEEGVYEDIKNGIIHIIWTGGEPTISGHQQSILNFYEYWEEKEYSKNLTDLFTFSEIETNGTNVISADLMDKWIDQINCSPKLANSGMSEKARINPLAIARIMQHKNYQFKFVISTEEDVKEMFRTYIEPFHIPLQNVCCMPGLDDQKDFHERTRFVLEMAKKYKFVGLTRLHVSAWDKTTGV